MSWVAVGIGAATLVTSVVASQKKSAADEKQANQDATIGTWNAEQSISNMQAVEAQASAQEVQQRRISAQYLGKQRASIGDRGTGSLSTGSNFDVARASAISAEQDALNIRFAGQLKGAAYLQSAYGYMYGADVSQSNAAAIKDNAGFMAGTAALSSVASSYGTYARNQRLNTTASING